MTDPKSILEAALDDCSATKDDNATPATFQVLYSYGPETLIQLFNTSNYDFLIIIGEPVVRTSREVQNKPTYESWDIPVTAYAIDKYSSGTLIVTAVKLMEKVRRSIRAKIEGIATGSGYTTMITKEESRVRVWGMKYWETAFTVEYRESG